MLKEALLEIFERDLGKLADEINSYTDENKLWETRGDISNSAGNLCLHLLGNLNHFVGATLGENGYVRNRPIEFSSKGVSRNDLLASIEKTKTVIAETLNELPAEKFEEDFPVEKHDKAVKTDFMLLHLLTHFNYHLGQINYHRRLIEK
ncbi:MAG TPA: DUF1572 family protein [Pyrinomonadaceae bacterium]|jgi:uncharacterized damage-inducible protein DinB